MGLTMKSGAAKTLAVLLLSALAHISLAQELTLPLQSDDPVVLHLPERAPDAEMLEVYLEGAEIPVAGRHTIAGNSLSFTPAFGFEPSREYVARVFANGEDRQVAFHLHGEQAMVPVAVTGVYPSGDTLPENTLRFYIHFSVPMQPQVAFDYIRLLDATGTVDEAAFMRFKQELWNEDRTRLTILIDPGRIKREVATNVELGPALLAGRHYTLTVEGGWPSADGTTVLEGFSKNFLVSNPLRTRPDTRLWTASMPCAGTLDPLTVTFDRPFDRHLLSRALRLVSGSNDEIEGLIDVEGAEQVWTFTPVQPWPAEDLLLVADVALEDVAGNNFRDLLDHVAGQHSNEIAQTELSIPIRSCRS